MCVCPNPDPGPSMPLCERDAPEPGLCPRGTRPAHNGASEQLGWKCVCTCSVPCARPHLTTEPLPRATCSERHGGAPTDPSDGSPPQGRARQPMALLHIFEGFQFKTMQWFYIAHALLGTFSICNFDKNCPLSPCLKRSWSQWAYLTSAPVPQATSSHPQSVPRASRRKACLRPTHTQPCWAHAPTAGGAMFVDNSSGSGSHGTKSQGFPLP